MGIFIKGFIHRRGQIENDKEQRESHGRRQRDKEHRGRDEDRKRQRHHYEFDKFMRRKEETKWGKGYCQDRAKKDQHHGYSFCPETGDKLGKDDREDMGNRKERIRNKVNNTKEHKHLSWSCISIPKVLRKQSYTFYCHDLVSPACVAQESTCNTILTRYLQNICLFDIMSLGNTIPMQSPSRGFQ